jgi:hypothetical protein
MTKADLLEQMLGLCPERDLEQLCQLTTGLFERREAPGAERIRFESTRARGLAGFSGGLLPQWRRVLVTGGTGCVGTVVLSRLAWDLPGAQLVSVARHLPHRDRRVAGVRYLRGDVRDPSRVAAVLAEVRPDLIVHLAAQRDPGYAERHVVETVSTNVTGTQVVLDAAGRAGIANVVVASTGKAVRLFTSDIYAATKRVVEYQAAAAAEQYGMRVACSRFTHVVDNSIIGTRINRWIQANEPIRLHSPHIYLPVQSALECYQLLITAALVTTSPEAKVLAIRDLGWPPVSLVDLALDYIDHARPRRAAICFTGYPAGYEAQAYPGTYDPRTAGDVSPLINCLEARRTTPTNVLGAVLDEFPLSKAPSAGVERALGQLLLGCPTTPSPRDRQGEARVCALLRSVSITLLDRSIDEAGTAAARPFALGRSFDRRVDDHRLIHEHFAAHGPGRSADLLSAAS